LSISLSPTIVASTAQFFNAFKGNNMQIFNDMIERFKRKCQHRFKQFTFFLVNKWYSEEPGWVTTVLRPFSWLFYTISRVRYYLYRFKIFKSRTFQTPIIVVGNITVGGTGKTPLVIHLANFFQSKGFHPGIVSRGYARKNQQTLFVTPESDPQEVGDEPLLIARKTLLPVAVAARRADAIEALLLRYQCDLIISDDGLQHYALDRAVEIAVMDGKRRFGNGFYFPAGPLREPIDRLKEVHFLVSVGEPTQQAYLMRIEPSLVCWQVNGDESKALTDFHGKTVHAVAGIAFPHQFFSLLQQLGMTVIEHPFPDHHHFSSDDLTFSDLHPVLMTEKDAVKCESISTQNHWFVPIETELSDNFEKKILDGVQMLVKQRQRYLQFN